MTGQQRHGSPRALRLRLAVAAAAGVLLAALPIGAPPGTAAFSTQPLGTWSPNGTVYAIAATARTVYIGGSFTRLHNPTTGEYVARSRLAAFDADTGELRSWAPETDATVRALAISPDGSSVFVGGMFQQIDSRPANRLAAVDAITGTLRTGWRGDSAGSVFDMAVVQDRLYVAGTFSRVNGIRRLGLAALNASDGSLVADWLTRITGGRPRAMTVAADSSQLYIGGNFTSVDDQPREFLASVDIATGAATSWAPRRDCANCYIFDLAAGDANVYAAVGGAGGGRAIAYRADTGRQAWLVHGDGNVQAIATDGELVYAGGHFAPSFGGTTRNQLAAIDAVTGNLDDAFAPDMGTRAYPGVWAIVADQGRLRVGGGFTSVDQQDHARYVEFPAR